jgi:hypothetical protein
MDNMIFRTVLILLAAFVLFALMNYYNNKQNTVKSEKFYQMNTAPLSMPPPPQDPKIAKKEAYQDFLSPSTNNIQKISLDGDFVVPAEPLGNEDYRAVDYEGKKLPNDCFPKDRLTSDDLLPRDAANSKWAQVNPAGQGDVRDQNFLNAGYMIGINTVGSSLKNANLQIRSEPVIPKVSVGPFLNSSYEASDTLRRPLEIGGDC